MHTSLPCTHQIVLFTHLANAFAPILPQAQRQSSEKWGIDPQEAQSLARCQKTKEQIRASCHVHPGELGESSQQQQRKSALDMFRNFEKNLQDKSVNCQTSLLVMEPVPLPVNSENISKIRKWPDQELSVIATVAVKYSESMDDVQILTYSTQNWKKSCPMPMSRQGIMGNLFLMFLFCMDSSSIGSSSMYSTTYLQFQTQNMVMGLPSTDITPKMRIVSQCVSPRVHQLYRREGPLAWRTLSEVGRLRRCESRLIQTILLYLFNFPIFPRVVLYISCVLLLTKLP